MSVAYVKRAVNRLRQRGVVDVLAYGSRVVHKTLMGAAIDYRYLGRATRDRRVQEITGIRPSMHTDYAVLRALFDRVAVRDNDVLVDVGCGEGRVIAYWLQRFRKHKLVGIEINPRAASLAKLALTRWPNVTILHGDATEMAPKDGTLFYLFNTLPFEALTKLEQRVRDNPGVRVLIYNFLEPDVGCFSPNLWSRDEFSDATHWRQYRAVLFTRV